MALDKFTELTAKCDALACLLTHLPALLEDSGVIDGHRLQEAMLAGRPHGTPMLDRSAQLLEELVSKMSDARATRRTRAMWSKNLGSPDE